MDEATQQAHGDDTQSPTPTIAPPPFDKPSADIVLRTADYVDFCVRRAILEEASAVFADMFSLPQPSPGADSSSRTPPILVSEDSKTIEALLRMCYPVSDPEFASLDELKPAMEAARKYQMDGLMPTFTRRLVALSGLFPLQAYALALQYGMEDTARVAAKHFLSLPHPWRYVAELEHISGGAYFRLLSYREACAQAAKGATRGTEWLEDGKYTWFTCGSADCPRPKARNKVCIMSIRGGDEIEARPYFDVHLARTAALLAAKPSRSTVDHAGAYMQLVQDAAPCSTCKSLIAADASRFHQNLALEVDKRVNEVVLKIKL
ncbi:uncharacterized protein TRAVEDRAFT_47742 [Trametes versicolor FP-101664 SS1]|uniref:uncharacterized protein n=1 Tax=Trametes versicolor (strain FP-101664) TaxID=717944 RepID=UPI00046237C2|nr:uncharacterized protein TRAVEDRAFT_47742 [Trametes versicolor FP-101664 SS1]EIW58599.1 hypothetical protein TRAVEDRAFT_47742 [Trametes versicolor FP-101664 SS1]